MRRALSPTASALMAKVPRLSLLHAGACGVVVNNNGGDALAARVPALAGNATDLMDAAQPIARQACC